jgi:AraC-like DNA-binding protein
MASHLDSQSIRPTVQTVDAPLGCWTSASWIPDEGAPLFEMVERVWYFDGATTQPKERIFPDGCAELILQLDDVYRDGDSPALAHFPKICFNGLRSKPSVIVGPGRRCRVLGIRFTPVGGCMLLHSTIRDLRDVTVDFRECAGDAANELGERCASAAETSPRDAGQNAISAIRAAVSWIWEHAVTEFEVDASVLVAVRAIRSARGSLPLDALGPDLRLTRSRLAHRFFDAFGVTPKRFARIVRFRNALSHLGREESIAGAAAELGYYDQSHMYRDFEEFGGIAPGAFLSAERYPDSASLAES